jgi:4-alpha-glucanotransferase
MSQPNDPARPHPRVEEALEALGIRHLLLGIHDPAFPSLPDEDVGRGTPYSEGAAQFLRFVRSLGFGGLQLGPQGLTSAINQSPYDGTLFSRNPMSVGFLPLTRPEWGHLLKGEALAEAVAGRLGPPDRVAYRYAYHVTETLLRQVWTAYRTRLRSREDPAAELSERFAAFRGRSAEWLERDGLYEALRRAHGGQTWERWQTPAGEPHEDRFLWDPPPGRQAEASRRLGLHLQRHAGTIEAYAFVQFLVSEQHRELRRRASALGLELFGDLQIGISDRDAWSARSFLLREYVMGAPPSRTNPEGQPWGYAVLDPGRYFGKEGSTLARGPALRFMRARAEKIFAEFDGLRIDHPHGLICPWVYRADEPDGLRSVQHGARLFASPDLPDHPELAAYAIVEPEQLDRTLPRYADGWVRSLSPEQVTRYAVLLREVMEASHSGGGPEQIACEILSTQPYPVARVLEGYRLGRFRVTQKADLDRAEDVYRAENARPEDWIMLGNHDTRPIWVAAEEWKAAGVSGKQAEYLSRRLLAPEEDRDAWIRRTAGNAEELVQAKFADLLAGPAQNVLVFFTDLFGYRTPYNTPGSVSEENWSLRLPPDYREVYCGLRAENRALNVPKALARALRSRGRTVAEERRGLLEELDRLAGERPA